MQEKILSSLVNEALKPASNVVDALLGPKIERIRTNARKKELKDRLQDSVINELLENYFQKLHDRVSEIKTLVFPEQVLPLTDIYEPLSLTKMTGNNFQLKSSSEKIVFGAKDLKSNQNYLIIDSAGMGKSTFSKYLVLDIFKSTIKIPIFLELRRIDDNETLLGKIAKDLDESKNDIDENFLILLLSQGDYVIILDGYDELSENVREKIGEQITELAVKCRKNNVILTSRPEVGLPDIPKSIVYNIQPLERKQAESLVRRYDNYAKVDVGKRLISQFNKVSKEFLRTPLLLVLLYKTYGYNNSIATNVTSFYDDVYNALYKGHDLSKAGFSRAKASGLDQENFRRLLQGFSFLLLTSGKYGVKSKLEGQEIIEKAIGLTLVNPSSKANFFEDLLISVPFLINDGGEFRFIHKSIAEFFAAEFLAVTPEAEKKIKIILQSKLSRTFNQSLNFLLALNPSLFRRAILAPAAKVYLSTKEISKDPFTRTLYVCGITHIGITSQPDETRAKGGFFAELDSNSKKWLTFRGKENILKFPSSTWSFLGTPVKTDFRSTRSSTVFQKDIQELVKMRTFISLSSKTITKYTNNQVVKKIGGSLINFLQNSNGSTHWILDDKACKDVLKVIKEEREAQNQLNIIISRSK
ncbi:MAG TPA: NACHT domain-containing protein [Candidatus Nitrosotenuis sp.]|nr:NACHT domain-containing protein [Candidatus Nitrosotenuis sp.]